MKPAPVKSLSLSPLYFMGVFILANLAMAVSINGGKYLLGMDRLSCSVLAGVLATAASLVWHFWGYDKCRQRLTRSS